VSGATEAELRRSVDRNRPKSTEGRYGDGWTHWNVAWRYDWSRSQDACRLTRVSTTLTIRTTLPRWSAPERRPTIVARWNRYLRALLEHEDGHARNGRDALRAVGERLRSLPPEPDCARLQAAVDAAAQEVIAEHGARDRSYDLLTTYGTTQGATFP
jgi:predicted secreted Zn-dependent protease